MPLRSDDYRPDNANGVETAPVSRVVATTLIRPGAVAAFGAATKEEPMLRKPNVNVITFALLAVVLAVFAGVGYGAPGGNGKGQGQGGQDTTTSGTATDTPTSTSTNTATSNTSAGNGKGQGKADPSSASCSFSNDVVAASGLPTGVVINFMISDSSGTSGWVLGFTDSGTWSVSVPAPNGPTTYQFVSQTWGPNGSKYSVYASCSA
jgi:hypothetical protein